MARPRVRPARRVAFRRTAALFGPALAAGLAAVVAVGPGLATASPAVTGVVRAAALDPEIEPTTDPAAEPGTDPTDVPPTVDPTVAEPTTAPPTESAPPETTPPAAPTTDPAPAPATPTKPAPTPLRTSAPPPPPVVVPPAQPAQPVQPAQPAGDRLGVRVTTEDVTLPTAYWHSRSTVTTLRVTVTNTGGTAERIRLGYTLPAGLTDAGTPGCVPAGGGNYRCGEWSAEPGARFSSTVRLRVAGTAWKAMPLSGSVRVIATAPGVPGMAGDDEGFAVLFPPGPPVPGISLQADDVVFDISGAPTTLTVRLGNTGKVDATGRVEVSLPAGVTATDLPAGCTAMAPERTRCDLGTLAPGGTRQVRLLVAATPQAQRRAPLAGAVLGRLDPRSGRDRQVQMSFRITAAAALATPTGTPAPTGSQGVLAADHQLGGDDAGSTHRMAIILIVISGVLVVLALGLATTSLRRRMTGRPAGR